MKAREIVRALGDLLLPPACLVCGSRLVIPSPSVPPRLVCDSCRAGIRPPPSPGCRRCGYPLGTGSPLESDCLQCRSWSPSLGRVRSATVSSPSAYRLVHALKYGGWPSVAGEMARLMVRSTGFRAAAGACVLIPVPTTRKRRARRGFNQAELLARELGRITGYPVDAALLLRVEGRSQVGLHPHERWTNVHGAFGLASSPSRTTTGRRLVLVDDVLTTGATLSAAAECLAQGLGTEVDAMVFLRAWRQLD